jgi:hypothetical protein
MTTSTSTTTSARKTAIAALFFGPIAASADLSVSYALVPHAQAVSNKTAIYVVTAVTMLVTVAGIMLAARSRKTEGGAPVDRFLAVAGMALNAYFLLVIMGFTVPKLLLNPGD